MANYSYYWENRYRYTYRRGPVPYTGVSRSTLDRKVKCWFGNYRQDRIPEYESFVRKKGRYPYAWDPETYRVLDRSWKHNSKKRHQWE